MREDTATEDRARRTDRARGIAAAALAGLAVAAFAGPAALGPRESSAVPAAALPTLGPDGAVYPGLTSVSVLTSVQHTGTGAGVYPALRAPSRLTFPSAAAVDAARRWLAGRRGRVAFAVADRRGGIRGAHLRRPFASASLVKAMLLVAYLRQAERGEAPLDLAARRRLDRMIRSSDNDAASAVFAALGPPALRDLARAARMRSFAVGALWGNARVTAADQARLFLSLDRLIPARERGFARRLLAGIVPEHSWGIPQAARPRWRVLFKGGWRPAQGGAIVHQAALLEGSYRTLALAVLSEGNPAEPYGQATIRGVARILLSDRPRRAGRSSSRGNRPRRGRRRAAVRATAGRALERSAGRLLPLVELGRRAAPLRLVPMTAGPPAPLGGK